MAAARDIVIIGAGHNALIAAFYLARAGKKVLMLERRPVVGGAAVTEEFHPGFRCSTLLHSAEPLRPQIVRDLGLEKTVAAWARPEPCVFAPALDGRGLLLYRDAAKSAAEIARLSKRDAEQYPEFVRVLARLAGAIAPLLDVTPPDIEDPSAEIGRAHV